MANRYWVGGASTSGAGRSWDNTAKWSTSTGGSGGASVPTTGDVAIFDANSGLTNSTHYIEVPTTRTVAGVTFSSAGAGSGLRLLANLTVTGDFISDSQTDVRLAGFTLTAGQYRNGNASATTTFASGVLVVTGVDSGGSCCAVRDAGPTTTVNGTVRLTNSGSGTRTIVLNTLGGFLDTKIEAGSGTIIQGNSNFGDLDFTGFTGSWTHASTSISTNMKGDLILTSGMTVGVSGGTGAVTWTASGSMDAKGKTIDRPLTVNGSGITLTLAGDINCGTRALTVTTGTLDTAGYAVSCGTFNTGAAGILTLGASIVSVVNTGTVVSINASSTLNAGTSTIRMTDATTSGKNFSGGGKTFYNVEYLGGGTGANTISGSNTFNTLKLGYHTSSGDRTFSFTAGTTQTVTNFDATGISGRYIVIQSTSSGSQWSISKASGTVTCDYLKIKDSIATGGATWNPGANSINNGNNVGWFGGGGGSTGSMFALFSIAMLLSKAALSGIMGGPVAYGRRPLPRSGRNYAVHRKDSRRKAA